MSLNFLIAIPRFGRRVDAQYVFPMGLAYIGGSLKAAGHRVAYVNLNHCQDEIDAAVESKLAEFTPDVFCTGGLSVHYEYIKEVYDAVTSAAPEVVTVLGGGFFSSEPELVMRDFGADYGVISEGEETMLELARAIEAGSRPEDIEAIDGLVYWQGEECKRTKARTAIEDLDALPWPDYEGIDLEKYFAVQQEKTNARYMSVVNNPRYFAVVSSRSCPYACTFCYHPIGRKYRERSLDDLFAEIDYLLNHYEVNILGVLDELFAVKRERLIEFCERIKPYDVHWIVQIRVDLVDRELLQLMKDSGCYAISYGLESHDDGVLSSMKKYITAEGIDRALELTYEAKIGLQGNFIFGDPAETLDSAKNTLRWWSRHPQYSINIFLVQIYPGTPIYMDALETGKVPDRLEFLKEGCPPINITKMPDEDFVEMERLVRDYGRLSGVFGSFISKESHPAPQDPSTTLFDVAMQCPHCGDDVHYRDLSATMYDAVFNVPKGQVACQSCKLRFYVSKQDILEHPPEITALYEQAIEKQRSGDLRDAYKDFIQTYVDSGRQHADAIYRSSRLARAFGWEEKHASQLTRAVRLRCNVLEWKREWAELLDRQGDTFGAELVRNELEVIEAMPFANKGEGSIALQHRPRSTSSKSRQPGPPSPSTTP